MSVTNTTFAEETSPIDAQSVRIAIARKGVSAREIERQSGVSRLIISAWVNYGAKKAQLINIRAVASVLEVPYEVLINSGLSDVVERHIADRRTDRLNRLKGGTHTENQP